jgi:hypothetical protein
MNKTPRGRKYTVDTHPDREAIIAAIIRGDRSLRNIAAQFNLPTTCVATYVKYKLASQAAAVMAADGEKNGTNLLGEIRLLMKRMNKLYDACDEYLQHPDDPEKYDLGPKAWEIDVTYRMPDAKNPKKLTSGRDTLNNLLARLEKRRIQPLSVWFRHTDPRKLIVDTAGVLSKQLELIAKIEGRVQLFGGDTTVNVLVINRKSEEEQDGS